ncbi:hypothetical protein FHS83_001676 [Rhizomicrobium palustre]|uniref:Glycosyl transferase family 1 domain-containing protein n=1 Tax=Rhizomicrobium palustre TaxID=189966 RepID=A0A846MXP4_9PROT|nr:glycosyltransferase [Rhizomicrobium palustre]NIK88358.1 hypothetical protein [Rhizomicrobium palustre]
MGSDKKLVLCDFWYADELPALTVPFEPYARERLGHWAVPFLKIPPLRAMALLWLGRKFDAVAPNWYRGGRFACFLQSLTGRKCLILLECIDYGVEAKGPLTRFLYRILFQPFMGAALRRSVAGLQVLTCRERDLFKTRYGLSAQAITLITWPLKGWLKPQAAVKPAQGYYVFSSGRSACDWETLFKAAEIGGWALKIACSTKDLGLVKALNARGTVDVQCEVSLAEHDAYVAGAQLYVLCLQEQYKSSGQVRLAACIEAGVPVVASDVRGLEGYLVDGVSAAVVPPKNPEALAKRVAALLADPEARADLTRRAREYADGYTRADYFRAVEGFVRDALARAEP